MKNVHTIFARLSRAAAVLLVAAGFTVSLFGQPNAHQIAILRWYSMNQAAALPFQYLDTVALAFDGANMWVATEYTPGNTTISPELVKMRASDGAVLATFSLPVVALAFDGANIWAADGFQTVSKIRASDGQILGTFLVGNNTKALAFDGGHIWVGNSGNLIKLRPRDGAVLLTVPLYCGCGMAFDGSSLWVANWQSVVKLRPSDGAILGQYITRGNACSVSFDGTDIWAADCLNTITKLRPSEGAGLAFITLVQPFAMAFDGSAMWVLSLDSNGVNMVVNKLRATDAVSLGTFNMQGGASGVVAFDGANIWVGNTYSLLKM